MKTTIKRIIFIIGLLFIGLLVNSNINIEELPSPTISPSYIDSDIFMEDDIDIENWMTHPFTDNFSKKHNEVYEERLAVEMWMTKPFSDTVEESLELEDWMLVPFSTI